jgi:AraC family transcriptional regulator
MEPKIIDLEALNLVGVAFYGDSTEGKFARVWDRFMQLEKLVTQRVNEKTYYGVEIYGPEFFQSMLWTYFPAVAVSSLQDIPGPMLGKTLPASKYAVFTVTGGLARIREMFHYAYSEWIPASDYEVAHPFDFELYDERFHGDVADSQIDVHIPIKAK